MNQPDTFHQKALDLKQDLKDLDIKYIIEQNEQDMEFLEWYREDLDDLVIWDKSTEAKIKNLGYKFSNQISLDKKNKKSCFKKLQQENNGLIRFQNSVVNGRHPEVHKLINLRDQVPQWGIIMCSE